MQHKSCSVEIYRSNHRGRFRHEVRRHDSDGVLQRWTFDDFDRVKEHPTLSASSCTPNT